MFRFAHPEILYALLLIPLFWILHLLILRRKRKTLQRLGDGNVVKRLTEGFSKARGNVKFLFLMLAWAMLTLGAANPQLGSRLENVKRKGIDLMIVLDVSNSMMAEDIKPNRLERSRQSISQLINKLQGDRVGLVIFAGKAYLQMPLTTDYSAARLFLSTVNTDMIPVQGTAIADAITIAVRSFDDNNHEKAIVVITDGENHQGDVHQAALMAAENGIRIYTIGMGLPEGGPIPLYQNGRPIGFKKDKQGNTIVTRLDDATLQKIAEAGGGIYIRANNTRAGLTKVFDEINALEKSEIESRVFSDYEDRFQYFIALGLLFLLIEGFISSRKSKWLSSINLFKEQ
ncbi:MAG TPA: VWA domain-containing protein [Bacteroidales bacterium]|nr:VWA domain-containing protein [Bacteroidales bacterium]